VRILVLNPGSSSLKASLIESSGDATLAQASAPWTPGRGASEARAETLTATIEHVIRAGGDGAVGAVGYRVVHGGMSFPLPTRVDDAVVEQVDALDVWAPLHNRIAAETIRATRRLMPDVAHVACFDTAFHATLDEAAWRYPVPPDWHTRWGIRRFGFHGLSVAWAVERAAMLLDRPIAELHLVVAHLGSGSSVTAVGGGRSVDTSMGFTPLEGLMMGTRSGSIDPGIVLYLLRGGMETEELADTLEHRSGLVGVSGRSSDVAELERAHAAGDAAAGLALELYARRAAAWIASMATALERLDAVLFTGGIGEHSAKVRSAVCERLAVLGVEPTSADPTKDDTDVVLSEQGVRVAILRVVAREDLVIARQAAGLLDGTKRQAPI
jgi:acetate kinase